MSPTRPRVSVLIPTYQSARFLTEAIDSAFAQDEAPHEVIVVDDASSDETPAVLAGYGDALVTSRHPENRGVAAARNTALGLASGDVITMLDADDRMLPHRLRVSVDHLLEGGEAVGCVLGKQRTFQRAPEDLPLWARDLDGSPTPFASSQITAWRHVLEELGGYDEAFTVGEDSDLLLRLQAAGLEVRFVDEVLNERRIHDLNISQQFVDQSRPAYLTSVRALIERRRAGS